jgi:hypothetical protein
MTESGEVDYDGFRRLIQFQITEGIDGIVPLGTTGETPTLDETEEEKLLEIAVKEAGGKIPVIAGAGSNDTRHMVKYVERAKKMAIGLNAEHPWKGFQPCCYPAVRARRRDSLLCIRLHDGCLTAKGEH